MPKTIKIEGDDVVIDENYYALYKIQEKTNEMLEKVMNQLRRLNG